MKYLDVIGIDEAGRGCLAGCLYIASCYLPKDFDISILRDSKKTSKKQRKEIFQKISENKNTIWNYKAISPKIIDKINILNSVKLGIVELKKELSYKIKNKDIIIDGNIDFGLGSCMVKGDSQIASIAGASIIAKYHKDLEDEKNHIEYPEYNFIKNSGYGTKDHIERIKKYGLSKIHRKTYKIKSLIHIEPSKIY